MSIAHKDFDDEIIENTEDEQPSKQYVSKRAEVAIDIEEIEEKFSTASKHTMHKSTAFEEFVAQMQVRETRRNEEELEEIEQISARNIFFTREREAIKEVDLTEENIDVTALHQRAATGDAYAMLQVANLYIAYKRNAGDYKKAFEWAKKSFDAGCIEAAFFLGEFYQYGTGCKKNVRTAKSYYAKLLKQKDLDIRLGPTTLGILYENYADLLIEQKKTFATRLAIDYYEKAAHFSIEGCKEKGKHLDEEWHQKKVEYQEKSIFATACLVTLLIAATVAFKTCIGPAKAFYENAFTGILTVKSADEVVTESVHSGVEMISDEISEFEKYQLVSEDLFAEQGYHLCQIQSAEASSEQVTSPGVNYGIQMTFDRKNYTAWQEADGDTAIGQTLSFYFDGEKAITGIAILNGNGRNEKAYLDHGRPKTITLIGGNQEVICSFEDVMSMQYIRLEEPLVGDMIALVIDDIYQGTESDTCITEIAFYE